MAIEPKAVFTIDAGKILAKLHLAAQMAVQDNCVVINTGISNPVEKADPANVGKVEFDFGNKSREYQVCLARNDSVRFSYKVQISTKKCKKLQDALKALEKQTGESLDLDEKAPDDEKTSLTDDKAKDKKDKSDAEKKKVDDKVKEAQDAVLKEFKEFKLNGYKEEKGNFKASAKSFSEAVKAENEKRKKDADAALAALKTTTFEEIQKYFTTFIGKDAASKITEQSLVKVDLDSDGKTASGAKFEHIKDYQIDGTALGKELSKTIPEMELKESGDYMTEPVSRTVGFCVGYSVDID